MLQIISAVIKDSEDKTNITLLFANQVMRKSYLMDKIGIIIVLIDFETLDPFCWLNFRS